MRMKKAMMLKMTAWGWKPHWAQLRTSEAWSVSRNASTAGRWDTGLQNVLTRKRKYNWIRLALQQMQALRKPNQSAVTAANQVIRKRTAERNTRTKPQLGVKRKL
jgi:hypothetical protein